MGGYLYQNYIGLELLCGWLDDPGQYQWVKLEADNEEIPKGLDDIVALQQNDKFTLFQVKFTVDPDDPELQLSWDWLLQHKPKGRSLIQKWFDSVNEIGSDKIAETALITNRKPDRDFYHCLDKTKNHVDFSLVQEDVKAKVLTQLGAEKDVEDFFRLFKFNHSHQHYLSLQRTLLDKFVPKYTDYSGWNYLFREAIDWSVRKEYPGPDGRITLDLLRGILNSKTKRILMRN